MQESLSQLIVVSSLDILWPSSYY